MDFSPPSPRRDHTLGSFEELNSALASMSFTDVREVLDETIRAVGTSAKLARNQAASAEKKRPAYLSRTMKPSLRKNRSDHMPDAFGRVSDRSTPESSESSSAFETFNWRRRTYSESTVPSKLLLPDHADMSKIVSLGPEIGKGASGVVYKATLLDMSKTVACKTISKFGLQLPSDAVALRNEAEALSLLHGHHSVIGFHGLFEDEQEIHFLMEYCAGGDLFTRVKEKRYFTEPEASIICKKIASALLHCHQHGVMHRDIKPENIFIVSKFNDTDVRIGDFGSAAFFEPGQKFTQLVGSSLYIAPSVLEGDYGPEADVWSLGVILFVMLCGFPPFLGATDQETFHNIKFGKLDLASRRWKYVSPQAKSLVSGLLEKDYNDRLSLEDVLGHEWIKNPCLCYESEIDDVPLAQPVPKSAIELLYSRRGKSRIEKFHSFSGATGPSKYRIDEEIEEEAPRTSRISSRKPVFGVHRLGSSSMNRK